MSRTTKAKKVARQVRNEAVFFIDNPLCQRLDRRESMEQSNMFSSGGCV
jgi:hypothetical protein